MPATCPSCNKFAALEFQDPEVDEEVKLEGLDVTATIRIVRSSECCSEEMKEAQLDLSYSLTADEGALADHYDFAAAGPKDGHELALDVDDVEQVEEGGSREELLRREYQLHDLVQLPGRHSRPARLGDDGREDRSVGDGGHELSNRTSRPSECLTGGSPSS